MTEPLPQELADAVIAQMEEWQVPGVAIGVIHAGHRFVQGFGVTSVDNPLPIDEHTLFQIGSTTKTFTATAIMKLVEAGKVDLEAPVRTYLPDFRLSDPAVADVVTLRHCLTHTGGWVGDYFVFAVRDRGDDALAKVVDRVHEAPQLTPPGAVFHYNNLGFNILGRIVEVVSGRPYEAFVSDEIFKPLGLSETWFLPEQVMLKRFAVGHIRRPDGPAVIGPWPVPRSDSPAGGISSTIADQLTYAAFHLGHPPAGSAPVLAPATIARMQVPLTEAGSMCDFVGTSWLIADLVGARQVGHGGATTGQMSAFQMVPERDFAVTVLTNADSGRALHAAVVARAEEVFLGVTGPARTPIPTTTALLNEAAGHYETHGSDMDLFVEDGSLRMKVDASRSFARSGRTVPPPEVPPFEVAFFAPDRLVALGGPTPGARGELLRDAAGRVEWLRWGGRIGRKTGG